MRCPTLLELPPPPPRTSGWPWTVESASLPPEMPEKGDWPKVSIITPSFNQARYLEATIRSILLQGYPNLEYFVFDGGSADGSVAVIEKYAPWIARWVSGPDGGQSAAINRGLQESAGDFVTWINSDDMLCRDALWSHASQAGFRAGVVYVGDCLYTDERGGTVSLHRARVHDFEDLVRVRTVWRGTPRGHIAQPEVLFPRELALAVGGVDVNNHRTMDYELWGKFLLAGAIFQYTHIPFGTFRLHGSQKTAQGWLQTQSLVATAARLVARAPLSEQLRRDLLDDLDAYQHTYWLNTGPLARLGLAEDTVLRVRETRAAVRGLASRLIRWRAV